MSTNRLAVDVGGTFTDVVHLDGSGAIRFEKVPTTPDDPSQGVIDSIARVDAALDRTSLFTHGTTLALNALLTRSGARTAVVATAGFRDVYLLGRTSRDGQLRHPLPDPSPPGGTVRHLRGNGAPHVRRRRPHRIR